MNNTDVNMTRPRPFVAQLAGIVADLSRSLPDQQRYQQLLNAVQASFPCDAVALLEYVDDTLLPRAVLGLSPDTLGRRFPVANHPRLAQILHSREPVRFPADSALPDPYDGLVDKHHEHLCVHDCMGAALYVDDQPWGVLTLDALTPGSFDSIDLRVFSAFVAVAAATVKAAGRIHQLEAELERHHLVYRTWSQEGANYELIGNSSPMQQMQREAITVAPSDLPVLVLGETGVGKELVARLIHRHSQRTEAPLIQVNCAALPEALAESELFGHTKGAFSGAASERLGKFELADRGTLFLDEVGELPLPVQAKLLRVLQNGEIQRLGSDQQLRVDVRIIAATNRDLKQEVLAGRFRADLYHRLSVYPLLVPPLRERGTDILKLAGYFLTRTQRQLGLRGIRLSDGARHWLTHHSWPGNVRELEHSLSRASLKALSEGQRRDEILVLLPLHLDAAAIVPSTNRSSTPAVAPALTLNEAVEEFRRELIRQRLQQHQHNLSATARSLGLDRGNFHRLVQRLGLKE